MERRSGERGAVGIWVGALALLAALALPAAAAANTDWMKLRAMNMAHQGGEDEAPSNTMYSYARALRLGADMLELDIHTTADGAIVAIHDGTVDRTTDGTGSVYEMTLEQIQALDAGHNSVPGEGTESDRPDSDYPFRGVRTGTRPPPPAFKPDDFRIPTLNEVMKAYPDVPINIEIKGASDEDVESFTRNAEILAAYLNELGRTEGVIVVSFNDGALARFHQLAPQIDLAPATGAVAAYKLTGTKPPQGTVAFQTPIEFGGVSVTDKKFVNDVHRDGYGIHVWTINDEPTMRTLLDWGVDGIMTAEPIRLEQVLCETDAPRPPRPASAPGRHCNGNASIACEVEPTAVKRKGEKKLRVTLRRRDGFVGQCAGRLAVKGLGTKARKKAKFDFGDVPPAPPNDGGGTDPDGDGPAQLDVTVKLNDKLRRAIERRGKVQTLAHPFSAFVVRERLPVK